MMFKFDIVKFIWAVTGGVKIEEHKRKNFKTFLCAKSFHRNIRKRLSFNGKV